MDERVVSSNEHPTPNTQHNNKTKVILATLLAVISYKQTKQRIHH